MKPNINISFKLTESENQILINNMIRKKILDKSKYLRGLIIEDSKKTEKENKGG